MVLARLDELGRGAWIALIVAGFWLWWPAGLALLGYLAFRRHAESEGSGPGFWYNAPSDGAGGTGRGPWANGSANGPSNGPWGQGAGQRGGWGGSWGGGCRSRRRAAPASGNRAFDDYRAETLRRLEEEQREFVDYLERLRQARDKSEFDAFMADRRNRQTPPAPPPAEAV